MLENLAGGIFHSVQSLITSSKWYRPVGCGFLRARSSRLPLMVVSEGQLGALFKCIRDIYPSSDHFDIFGPLSSTVWMFAPYDIVDQHDPGRGVTPHTSNRFSAWYRSPMFVYEILMTSTFISTRTLLSCRDARLASITDT